MHIPECVCLQVLAEPLEHLQSCAVEAVLPLFRAAAAEVEATILEMHSRDWSGAAAQGAAVLQPSSHMRRLDATLRRFRKEHLSHFVPQPALNVASSAALLCQRLAGRALAFFVRHAALIKPLGQQGKLQLARVRSHRARLNVSDILDPTPSLELRSV